jgi:hypothetical protein
MADRKINIDGAVWTYRVGKAFCSIRDPDGKRYVPSYQEVRPGTSLKDIENRNISISPRYIESWIRNLLNRAPEQGSQTLKVAPLWIPSDSGWEPGIFSLKPVLRLILSRNIGEPETAVPDVK